MPQEFKIQKPKRVLQDLSRLPAQVLPSGIGRPFANVLSSVADSVPDLPVPTSIPAPQLPAGLALPPTPKAFLARAETVLPTGLPRLSASLPDVQIPGVTATSGTPASGNDRHRPIERTGPSSAGASTGGYRRIS